MVGLRDIVPEVGSVTVNGATLTVYPIDLRGLGKLFARFPELRKLATGVEVTPERLIEVAPEAIASIIASGVGEPDAEEAAQSLPLGVQVDILSEIIRLTMPGGFGPFVDKITRVIGNLDQSGNQPVTR